MMRFPLKHPRFWGDLFIAAAMIGSNVGSAWAGTEYEALRHEPWEYCVPADYGFTIMAWTVYPLAIALLVLGIYFRTCIHKREKTRPGDVQRL